MRKNKTVFMLMLFCLWGFLNAGTAENRHLPHHVYSADGAPVEGATVEVFRVFEAWGKTNKTDPVSLAKFRTSAEGIFYIPEKVNELLGNTGKMRGSCRVLIRKKGYVSGVFSRKRDASGKGLRLPRLVILREGNLFEGKVVGEDGSPLPHVSVTSHLLSGYRFGNEEPGWDVLKTDGNGKFSFYTHAEKSLLQARLDGYVPYKGSHLTADGACVIKLRLGGKVTGVVKDWEAQCVNKASVTVDFGMFCLNAKTDGKGRFTVHGVPLDFKGRVSCAVHVDGYEAYYDNIKLPAEKPVRFILSRKPIMMARLIDRDTGMPIANADIGGLPVTVKTDDFGVVRFREPYFSYTPWFPSYTIVLESYLDSPRLYPAKASSQVQDLGTFYLSRRSNLPERIAREYGVKIVDEKKKSRHVFRKQDFLRDAESTIFKLTPERVERCIKSAKEHIPEDRRWMDDGLHVHKKGYIEDPVQAPSPGHCLVRGILIGPGGKQIVSRYETARISIYVSYQDGDCAGSPVGIYLNFDKSGRFFCELPALGKSNVFFANDSGHSKAEFLDLQDGGVIDNLFFKIEVPSGNAELVVVVTDEDDQPLANHCVGLRLLDHNPVRLRPIYCVKYPVKVGKGCYVFQHVPKGEAIIFPSTGPDEESDSHGFSFVEETDTKPPLWLWQQKPRVITVKDRTLVRMKVKKVPYPAGRIYGTVLPSSPGTTVKLDFSKKWYKKWDATISLSSCREGIPVPLSVSVFDEDSSEYTREPPFSYDKCSPGRYTVIAQSTDGWARETVTVKAGSSIKLDLKLKKAVPISGSIRMAGLRNEDYDLWLEGEEHFSFDVKQGKFQGLILPGRYEASYQYRGWCEMPDKCLYKFGVVDVKEDGPCRLDFRIPAGTLEIKVRKNGKSLLKYSGNLYSRDSKAFVESFYSKEESPPSLDLTNYPAGKYLIQIFDDTCVNHLNRDMGIFFVEILEDRVSTVTLDFNQLVPVTIKALDPKGRPAKWLKGDITFNGIVPFTLYDEDCFTIFVEEGRLSGRLGTVGTRMNPGYGGYRFGPYAVKRGQENQFTLHFLDGGILVLPLMGDPHKVPEVIPLAPDSLLGYPRFEREYAFQFESGLSSEAFGKLVGLGSGFVLRTGRIPPGLYRVEYEFDMVERTKIVQVKPGEVTAVFPDDP